MKKAIGFMLSVSLSVFIAQSCEAQNSHKILMISRLGGSDVDLYIAKEVHPMIAQLESEGYTVVVASASGQTVQGVSTFLRADADLSDISVSDFGGVLLPCIGSHGVPLAAIKVVKEAFSKGMVIAAGDGGVFVLEEAGILKGKRFAATKSDIGYFLDGVYRGEGVIQDDGIITAGLCIGDTAEDPSKIDATPELMRLFINAVRDRGAD